MNNTTDPNALADELLAMIPVLLNKHLDYSEELTKAAKALRAPVSGEVSVVLNQLKLSARAHDELNNQRLAALLWAAANLIRKLSAKLKTTQQAREGERAVNEGVER